MGEFIGGVMVFAMMVLMVIGGMHIEENISNKWQCEETHNVNHCECNLTYTPTYPEVTE